MINEQCINYKANNSDNKPRAGGAFCVCPKCKAERIKKETELKGLEVQLEPLKKELKKIEEKKKTNAQNDILKKAIKIIKDDSRYDGNSYYFLGLTYAVNILEQLKK